jgi:hypothetical protein
MSLRAAALVFGGEAIPFNAIEIASGKDKNALAMTY